VHLQGNLSSNIQVKYTHTDIPFETVNSEIYRIEKPIDFDSKPEE
jgi:hypothetical protein